METKTDYTTFPYEFIVSNLNLDTLPSEQLIHIIDHMDLNSIKKLSQTSRRMNEFLSDPILWKTLIRRDFHTEPATDDPRLEYLQRKKYPVGLKLDLHDVLRMIPTYPGEVMIYSPNDMAFHKMNVIEVVGAAKNAIRANNDDATIYVETSVQDPNLNVFNYLSELYVPQNKAITDVIPEEAWEA